MNNNKQKQHSAYDVLEKDLLLGKVLLTPTESEYRQFLLMLPNTSFRPVRSPWSVFVVPVSATFLTLLLIVVAGRNNTTVSPSRNVVTSKNESVETLALLLTQESSDTTYADNYIPLAGSANDTVLNNVGTSYDF